MKAMHCTLVFLVKDLEVLLGMKKRGLGQGYWNGIGGKIEPGEDEIPAMVRECQEEILVTPKEFQKVAVHEFINKDETGTPFNIIVHAYTCHNWEGHPTETDEMAPKWFHFDKVPYNQMWEDDQFWLPQVLEGKKVIGNFEFDKDNKVLSKKVAVVSNKELANVKI